MSQKTSRSESGEETNADPNQLNGDEDKKDERETA